MVTAAVDDGALHQISSGFHWPSSGSHTWKTLQSQSMVRHAKGKRSVFEQRTITFLKLSQLQLQSDTVAARSCLSLVDNDKDNDKVNDKE